jgi:hypothetical protein
MLAGALVADAGLGALMAGWGETMFIQQPRFIQQTG